MKHYTAEEWVDFTRGVLSIEDKSRMFSHLQTGCRRCAKEAAIWGRVTTAAKRHVQIDIPQGAVRQAKAMFQKPEVKTPKAMKPTLAGLLFDSMRAPAPLGVRSGSPSPRQLLFAAGDHRIDVRLEPHAGSDRVTITGQILNAASPDISQRKIPVSLHVGKKVAGTAETNELGEFQLEFELPCKVELRAVLPDGQQISVGLVEPAVPTLEGASYLYGSQGENERKLREAKKSTRRKV